MRGIKILVLLLLGMSLLSGGVNATTSYEEEYKKYDALAMEAWEKMPFKTKKALLVSRESTGYGMYLPRESNKYMAGENILIYIEPIGFGHKDFGKFYRIFMESSLVIENQKGEVVGKLDSFGKFKFDSKERNREIFLSLTVNLGQAPVGKYILVITLKDNIKNQKTLLKIPVEVIP